MQDITLIFDGGLKNYTDKARGNPYGSFIFYIGCQTTRIYRWIDNTKIVTSNEAEYICLARALQELFNVVKSKGITIKVLTIKGDSQLVQGQVGKRVLGEWAGDKCNFLHLQHHRDEIRSMLDNAGVEFDYQRRPRKEIVKILGH